MLFSEKLAAAQARSNSWLCVGLDPDSAKMPPSLQGKPHALVEFNRAIIEATRDLACAYKPNLAFFMAHGSSGIAALVETVRIIPLDMPIILDAKFGDIDSSAMGYARFAFEVLQADAVTVSPYLGADALAPFLAYKDKAIFLLVHTSNPGSSDIQDALVATGSVEELPEPVYVQVTRMASRLQGQAEVGLVVGATFPEQLKDVRDNNPRAIFLIPGIGAQGGCLKEAVESGHNESGVGPLINASRSILFASHGVDYAEAARVAALQLRDEINAARSRGAR